MYAFADLIAKTFGNASIVNTTAPDFDGIVSAVPNNDGSITVEWDAPTPNACATPIRFEVYVLPGSVSAATLFGSRNNIVKIVESNDLQTNVFTLADQTTYLIRNQEYTLGVRAISGVSIQESNMAIEVVTAIASGNLPVVFQNLAAAFASTQLDFEATEAAFENTQGDFELTQAAFESTVLDLNTIQTALDDSLADLQGLVNDLQIITNQFDSQLSRISSSFEITGQILEDEPLNGTTTES